MSRRRAFDASLSQTEESNTFTTPALTASQPPSALAQSAPSFTPALQEAQTKPLRKPQSRNKASVTPPESQTLPSTIPAPAILPAPVPQQGEGQDAEEEDVMPPEIDDRHQCFICAEQIQYWAQGACGHMTCHICALRLRIFYKKNDCTFCKTVLPSLCFSSTPNAPFPSEALLAPPTVPGTLDLSKFDHTDTKLGVVFETEDMMETTLLLLRFNCPYPDCAHMAASWDGLEKHTAAVHSLVLCGLCRRQLSRFAHEQVLYPPHLLALHDPSRLSRGQRPPKPRGKKEEEMVASWGAPHPMCEFCHEAFFSPDELFKHMRNRHEECFVCKASGQRDVYFRNYAQMETHFNQAHYPCIQPECLEKKFVVFGSAMDLSGHMVSDHGDTMSAKDRAQARQIQIEFSGTPAESSRRANGGRGPNAGGAPPALRGPMQQQIRYDAGFTPAEEARQRRQIQNDRRAAFGSNLTGDEPLARSGGNSGAATPREDADDATVESHNALITRVSFMVNHSENRLSSFRSAVRQYRNNESGAKDMIDTIFNVLDRDADSTAGVVKEVANLFKDDQEKTQTVLAALNAFRIEQRNQFPSLGSAPEAVGSGYADVSSGRVLSAKRATQNRGGSSRQVWDRVEQAAASHPANRPAGAIMAAQASRRHVPGALSPAAAFPALGSGSSILPKGQSPTPWAKAGASRGTAAPEPVIRSVNFPTASSSKSKPPSQSAFPSLPAASSSSRLSADQRKTLLSGPNVREETISRIRGTTNPVPVNGWGQVATGVVGLSLGDGQMGEQVEQVSSKKKGKKKELLFAVSARPS